MTSSPYRLTIDETRLLTEIPRLFQSLEEALVEVLQNSCRSHATRIGFSYSTREARLVVYDDGPGVVDPASVLTAGRSDWDASVVDPAGLGLFALMGLSDQLTLTSYPLDGAPWTATLTRDHWTGTPVDVRWLPPRAGFHGFRIEAQLTAEAVPSQSFQSLVEQARHFYPITVTYRDEDTEAPAVEIPTRAHPAISVPTRVGPLGITPPPLPTFSFGTAYHILGIVWEHRLLSAHNAYQDLRAVLETLPDGPLVLKALPRHLVWFADPAALHPRLPDRREPIQDRTYHSAIRTLAEDLVATFDAEGHRAHLQRLERPALIGDTSLPGAVAFSQTALAAERWPQLFHQEDPEIILPLAGYTACSWDDLGAIQVYEVGTFDQPETEVHVPVTKIWALNPIRVTDATVAELLCRHGHWAAHDPHGDDLHLTITGLETAPADTPNAPPVPIARAHAIHLCRADGSVVTTLPEVLLDADSSLTNPVDAEDEYGPCLIFTGSPDVIRDRLRSPAVVGAATTILYEDGSLYDYLDENRELDADLLSDDLIRGFNHTWDPEAYTHAEQDAARRTAHHDLVSLVSLVTELQSRLTALPEAAGPHRAAIAALGHALDAILPEVRTVADLISPPATA